ncbi:N-acetylglucosamine-6-phosphate deacetylase [Devosia algicola]|uniref:N-acetylglucosamine-6-phosphate deacetylase n=1 Tax=Devosia algicola TaxID=3026418 RepID=A0ABY7YMV4_9HYPH|nr:N-acetylglucosamine-6-phosphate deacetylase [Devosia algicola]WDR02596.1 N-acetylglucosamine-6-phosphate deacetylase [Devosia algicola]
MQRWTNATIIIPDGAVHKDLLIENGRFAAMISTDEPTGPDWQQIDVSGQILFPGIIDLLQHGFADHLYNDVDPDCVRQNSQLLAAHGVTGFLPSISCLPRDTLTDVLARLARECVVSSGARALGIHSEGPCFGAPGAHNPQNLQRPTTDLADAMLRAADGKLKAVTIAPELPGAEAFIGMMKGAGVSVHLGHSQARPENIARYAQWGIDAVTHMYNVMPSLPPRTDGVPIFSLTDALIAEPSIALGLICDGIHVHPKLVQALSHLPANRVFLETDANKYAGSSATEFEFYPGYWVTSLAGQSRSRPQWRPVRFVVEPRRGHAKLPRLFWQEFGPGRPCQQPDPGPGFGDGGRNRQYRNRQAC